MKSISGDKNMDSDIERKSDCGYINPLGFLLLFLAGLFLALFITLGDDAAKLKALFIDVSERSQKVELFRRPPPPPPPPTQMAEGTQPRAAAMSNLAMNLLDSDSGRISITETDDYFTISILGTEMFEENSYELSSRYAERIISIAQALNNVGGSITVIGYSDKNELSSELVPSYPVLSVRRAEAVMFLMAGPLENLARLKAEGRGILVTSLDNSNEDPTNNGRVVELVVEK